MSASDVTQGRVVNVLVDLDELDLVADESFTFDSGEDTENFDLATTTTTQTIPANSDPTIEFDLHIEEADKSGLDNLGVIDEDGNLQYSTGTRQIDELTVEYLDAEDGTVELEHKFNDVLVVLGSIDDDNPVAADITGHVNGSVELAVNVGSA